ncbi:hypothetical protein GCM10009733_011290 [Nonomuraea maheshkhaliensis]|uniref:FAD-binding domain-containing protein n=1 Tax=Nonomuraea maheshkhaliensis TaxID=419590 RepID=A0ABN2ESZ6_9ACTN
MSAHSDHPHTSGDAISVSVVGGGIGGLTTALPPPRRGVDAHVHEQAAEPSDAGAGVQISPDASRAPHGLGLAGDLGRTGVKPVALHQRRRDARVEAGVLVGADGIHSPARAAPFGPEHPRFTGRVAYRGLVPAERLRALGLEVTTQLWMGPGGHFVHYFVSGGRLVDFVAIAERDPWTRESWTDRRDVAEALAAFEG